MKPKIKGIFARVTLVALLMTTGAFGVPASTDAATQNAYRWRNDDGSESTATYAAAENTSLSIDPEDPKRLRFGVAGPVGEQPYVVTDTITTGGGPGHIAFTPNGDFAYVTSYADGNVYVIQASNHAIVDTINIGGQPGGAVVTPDGNHVYITNFADDTVYVVQTSDNTVVDTVPVGHIPIHPAVTPDGAYVYVPYANTGTDGQVDVIRTSDNTVIATVEAGSFAFEAVVTPDSAFVYVANQSENTVTVIRTSDNVVTDTITTIGNPYGITITADGSYIYLLNEGFQGIEKIRTSDNTTVDSTTVNFAGFSVALSSDESTLFVADWEGDMAMIYDAWTLDFIKSVNVGDAPQFVAFSPDTDEAFVADTNDGTISVIGREDGAPGQLVHEQVDTVAEPGAQDIAISSDGDFAYVTDCSDGTVTVIQTSDGSVVDTVSTGSCAWGVDVAPNGTRVYVANYSGDSVSVVQTSDNTVIDTIPVGDSPYGTVVTPDGAYIYVANSEGQTVSVIRASDDAVIDTISVGDGPYGLAITPDGAFVYVANDYDGSVSVIQTSSNTVVDTITIGSCPYGIDITSDGGLVYLTDFCDDGVYVIRTSDNTQTDFIQTGERPEGIDITPDDSLVYVAIRQNSPTMTVIRTSDDTIVDVIPEGNPVDVEVAPDDGRIWFVDQPNGVLVYESNNTIDFLRLEYGEKTSTCGAISSWTQVPATATSEDWEMSPTANLTDGASSTDSAGISNGLLTFKAGAVRDTTSELPALSFGAGQLTEVEFSIEATPSAAGNDYCFRLTDAGDPADYTYSQYAEADVTGGGGGSNDPTLTNAVTMTRLKAGTASTVSISFELQNELTSTFTATFPVGFTVTGAFTSGSCSGGGTVDTFAFSGGSRTMTAEKHACSGTLTLSGGTVVNPSSPGLYFITWTNDDPGEGGVAIVDDDQVTVTAQVGASITFDIDTATTDTESAAPYAVPLGTITTTDTRVSGATDGVNYIWLDLDTNAGAGAIITVKNANGASGLVSTAVPTDTIDSSTGAVSDGVENYGICSVAESDSGGNLDDLSPFDGSCAGNTEGNTVGGFNGSAQPIYDTDGAPIGGGRAQIAVQASIGGGTASHNDYTDTLTFIATGTY
jgi:YVTN family beta-propeller protein